MDLEAMGVRAELHPLILPDGKKKLPVASWSLQIKEKERLLWFLHELNVPTGYSSNIRRIANMNDLKFNMSCLKAHDCHVVMMQLLPITIRAVFSEKVWEPIIKFYSFFNAISHKVIDQMELKMLQDNLIYTLTRLEMHLPPTFFDMSVHLVVHHVRQIQ
jgi:hypothetical protein